MTMTETMARLARDETDEQAAEHDEGMMMMRKEEAMRQMSGWWMIESYRATAAPAGGADSQLKRANLSPSLWISLITSSHPIQLHSTDYPHSTPPLQCTSYASHDSTPHRNVTAIHLDCTGHRAVRVSSFPWLLSFSAAQWLWSCFSLVMGSVVIHQ
jgi:hypothetical protein